MVQQDVIPNCRVQAKSKEKPRSAAGFFQRTKCLGHQHLPYLTCKKVNFTLWDSPIDISVLNDKLHAKIVLPNLYLLRKY